ncbi:MFS transporter [Candidatus Poseidoniales archaeon]|nr:MFS transporter [Candidatus Thalassarchaeaceae archaeon]MDC0183912.1 MFS transporter [Candidatus Poseidoniales archaeon]
MSERVELDRESNPKAVRGYAFYDWGKSAFETSVTTAVLPAWFAYIFLKANGLEATILGMEMTSDAVWSFAVTIGALLVAFASPSLGVIADRRAIKMWWLRILTYLGAGSTFALAFAPMFDISFQWVWLFLMFLTANIGLNGAGVFYNALLPHMGTDDEMDAISNKAFAYGYLGGGLLLLVHLVMVMMIVDDNGSNPDWVIPFVMASSGAWWLGFAMLTFKYVPEPPIENEMESLSFSESASLAFTELRKTFGQIDRFKTLFIYMLAYFFFIDGINSVTALAGIYGITVLGLTTTALIATILVIQFVAAPCAIAFTKLAEATNTKYALTLSLVGWVVVVLGAMSFAPLALDAHSDYDIQYDWDSDGDGIADHSDDNIDGDWYTNEEEIAAGTDPLDASSHPPGLQSTLQQVRLEGVGQYVISTGANAYALTIAVEGDEQDWTSEWMDVMAVHQHEDYTDKTVYAFDDPENEYLISSTNNIERMEAFFATFTEESRFSYNVQGGPLDGSSGMGEKHPTSLGDGPLDAIPSTVRDLVWQPLGINVMFQFLLLGCMAGALLGGSQGLARSLFGQMVPETRSAEFFGFFGFFGKVAALLGPMIYGILTVAYDSRVGVASLCILIIIGTVMMRFVDVEAGRADAQAEDARNRGIEI